MVVRVGESDSQDALNETQSPSVESESLLSAGSLLRAVAALPAPAGEAEPDRRGSQIAHYRVQAELGRGGMGVVYLAEDVRLRRKVALKVLPQRLTRDPERRQRFLREARLASAIQAPNVGTVYDVGESDGTVWIAIEHVNGRTLRALLDEARGGLELSQMLDLAGQMAKGLAGAHRSGIVHRDIKPENVMVTADGLVKLLDFGLAKLDARDEEEPETELAGSDELASKLGRVMGTPAYMSPEQAKGEIVDARTDVWAMGVVLVEMVTGVRPSRERSVLVERRGLPVALGAIVDRCLRVDPDERFPSGVELSEALSRVGQGRPSRARYVAAAAVASVALAVGLATRSELPATNSAQPSAAPSASVAGLITYLNEPTPSTTNPEALALYRRARALQHEADWTAAEPLLRKAVELDPHSGEAQLQLAFSEYSDNQTVLASTRETYRRAVAERGRVDERTRRFIAVLEPLLARDPPDPRRSLELFDRLIETYPLDVPILFARDVVYFHIYHATPVADVERMIALDPDYADAWQWLISARMEAGRFDEAAEAVEHCHQLAPNSKECSIDALTLFDFTGRCDAAAEEGRRAVGSRNKIPYPAVLLGLGRPRERVLEAFASVWDACSLPRSFTEPLDRGVALAAYDGDLRAAMASSRLAFEVAQREHLQESLHWDALKGWTLSAAEAGELVSVAPELRAALASQAEWASKENYMGDASLVVWAALRASGRADATELEDARVRFERRWATELAEHPTRGWAAVWGPVVETREQALAALAKAPAALDDKEFISFPVPAVGVGKILLLAGRPAEAIPWFRLLTTTCSGWSSPYDLMLAHRLLGQAYEAEGASDSACASYGALLARWEGARPRSRTAAAVRERARRLGCSR